MRYVVAADSGCVGNIVERQAVNIMLVNKGGDPLESTVLFAFALRIDNLDKSVCKQLIKRFIHLAVNEKLEKLGFFGLRSRRGLNAVEKLRMCSFAGRDPRIVGAIAVDQRFDNALREVVLSYRRRIGKVDGNDKIVRYNEYSSDKEGKKSVNLADIFDQLDEEVEIN